MRSIEPAPNLLLVGAPKSGTTSLLLWLRNHSEVYHPWQRVNSGAVESGFLLGGVVDSPYEMSKPRGTLFLPHEADMDYSLLTSPRNISIPNEPLILSRN